MGAFGEDSSHTGIGGVRNAYCINDWVLPVCVDGNYDSGADYLYWLAGSEIMTFSFSSLDAG